MNWHTRVSAAVHLRVAYWYAHLHGLMLHKHINESHAPGVQISLHDILHRCVNSNLLTSLRSFNERRQQGSDCPFVSFGNVSCFGVNLTKGHIPGNHVMPL